MQEKFKALTPLILTFRNLIVDNFGNIHSKGLMDKNVSILLCPIIDQSHTISKTINQGANCELINGFRCVKISRSID